MHRVEVTGEGVAEFTLSGGRSEASVLFGEFGVKDPTDGGFALTGATLRIVNHKGDLTIEIPAFDAYVGFTIVVRGDHSIRVEQLKP